MRIAHREVGPESPPLVIAEIGINHGGSLDVAKVKPASFDPAGRRYFGLGECLGDAFSIGKGRFGAKS